MKGKDQKTILLVEDEAIIAMTEKMTLEKFGYKVIIANSGEQAVAAVEKTPAIDLILMDINLGAGIDGTEAAAVILRQRDLPVVFLSSHMEPEVVAKTEKITSYGYVVKNSSITVLDASIKMAFKLFEAKTKEQEKEEALCKSEEKFKQLFTQMPSAVAIYDAVDGGEDFVFKDFNIAAEKIEGIKKDDLVGKRVTQVFPGVKKFGIFAVFQRVWRTGQPEFFPSAIYRDERDPGTWRESWVYKLASGELIAIYNDITERKQAEEAIFQSKKDWEDCFDSITDMITIHDNDYNIIRSNKAGKTLLKLPAFEKQLKLKCFSFYHGSDVPPTGCPSCECLKSGMAGVFEVFEPHLNRFLEIRAIPRFDSDNQRAGLIHIVRDITERKRGESQREAALKALQESEQRLNFHANNSPLATIEWTTDFIVTRWSVEAEKMFGWNQSETIGKPLMDLQMIYNEDIPSVQKTMERLSDGSSKRVISTNRNYTKEGKVIICEWYNSVLLNPQGKMISIMSQAMDITERRRDEEQLRFLSSVAENITDSITITDANFAITYINKMGEKLFGYTLDELKGQTPGIFNAEPMAEQIQQELYKIVSSGNTYLGESLNRRKDGSTFYCEYKVMPLKDSKGIIYGYTSIQRDISERKEVEEKIKNLAKFPSENPSPILRLDKDGVVLYANEASAGLLQHWGCAAGSHAPTFWLDLVTEAISSQSKRAIVIEFGEQTYSFDVIPILNAGYVNLYGSNITERKQAESQNEAALEALRESEEKYRTIGEAVPYGVWRTDARGYCTYVSESFLELVDMTMEQIQEFGWLHLLPPEDAEPTKEHWLHCVQTGEDFEREHRFRAKDGNYRNILAIGRPIKDNTGKIAKWVGLNLNITERKRVEGEIKRQLAEKVILLKEVHHRIKNNIASVGNLISLRLQSVTNPEAIAVLQDAIGRVDSIRILYDKLLLSEDYKDVSVKNYIESLSETAVTLFPGKSKITLEKQIADFQLDSKRLFPIGIIINELISNAMKYAFDKKKSGLIQLSLAKVDSHVTLIIQDNGIGLPDDFDSEKSKGFGLMLVKMLSQQLGGSFSLEKHKGTRCTVEFNI